jgi:hypothetical protein
MLVALRRLRICAFLRVLMLVWVGLWATAPANAQSGTLPTYYASFREGLQNLESTPMARGMKLEDDAGHEAIELWL